MDIQSEYRIYPNRSGRKMAAWIDARGDQRGKTPIVVIAPKFGESKKNNLQLAYALAGNGLNVFRFDHLDHVGESEGDIMAYTFRGATEDIIDTVTYLQEEFQAQEIILLANSMSVRPAIRAAALDARIARFVSMVGMVNFRHTSRVVYQEDMVGRHLAGERIGVTDILGHEVNVARFLDGTIAENMHDLAGTMEDVKTASSDFFFLCGERDAWIERKDMDMLQRVREDLRVRWIPGAMHEMRENPKAAEAALREAVFACKYGRFSKGPEELERIALPDRRAVIGQNRVEREQLKRSNPLVEAESRFWNKYLQKYGILEHIEDFQDYLRLVSESLGPVRAEDCLLDVGCGNGLFGMWTLRELIERDTAEPWARPVYFGLDLTPHGLREAMRKQGLSQVAAMGHQDKATGWMDFIYLPYDLEVLGRSLGGETIQLPFESGTFDKICCSLLLSYLKHPERVVAECFRVLKPGGRIVLSSMKPFCDLSTLYKDLVEQTDDPAILGQARNLLSAAGAIRLKEEHGHYTFFSIRDLKRLAENAGFHHARGFRSFGDQANLVAATR